MLPTRPNTSASIRIRLRCAGVVVQRRPLRSGSPKAAWRECRWILGRSANVLVREEEHMSIAHMAPLCTAVPSCQTVDGPIVRDFVASVPSSGTATADPGQRRTTLPADLVESNRRGGPPPASTAMALLSLKRREAHSHNLGSPTYNCAARHSDPPVWACTTECILTSPVGRIAAPRARATPLGRHGVLQPERCERPGRDPRFGEPQRAGRPGLTRWQADANTVCFTSIR